MFKPGDKVICINKDVSVLEGDNKYLQLNDIYIIDRINMYDDRILYFKYMNGIPFWNHGFKPKHYDTPLGRILYK